MIETFTAPESLPFAVALTIMVILGFIEGMGMVIGLGVSDLLDSLLPDIDADVDIDVDAGAEIDAPSLDHGADGVEIGHVQEIGPFTRMLSWLRIGRVPILVLVVIFLLAFGLSGLVMQTLLYSSLGFRLPALIAVVPALAIAIPTLRVLGGLAEKVIPRDESSAVSHDAFVGRVAVITVGTAREGSPAEGRLRDRYQQAHYVMIEPDDPAHELEQGSEVLIVRREGARFRAIPNPSAGLTDEEDA